MVQTVMKYLIFVSLFLSHAVQSIDTNNESTHIASKFEVSFTTDSPIYVVGDVHGAYSSIVTTLKILSLIDDNLQWIGSTAHFVSLGDLMDRGPSSRKVMDLFIKLQTQAEKAGGKFHVILGNHEIMNLVGDLRYLSNEEIGEFAEDESAEQRTKAFQTYLNGQNAEENTETLAEFNKQFPSGFFARQKAFSLSGKYGQWLTKLPFVIRINDQIFTHGGLSKKTEQYTINELNQNLNHALVVYLETWQKFVTTGNVSNLIPFAKRKQSIVMLGKNINKERFSEVSEHFLFSNESPTWFRGNAICHPFFEQDNLTNRLNKWQAKRLWVGHTTSQTRAPLNRLNDALVIMDTGMLNSYYKGEPWAAKIVSNSPPVYIKGLSGEIGHSTLSSNRDWGNPYDMTDAQVENFLRTADIKITGNTKEGKTKPYVVELTKDNKVMKGIFKYKDTVPRAEKGHWSKNNNHADRFQYEMAAYHIDRMLGIGLVPVTVERKVGRKSGIIQIWVDGLISELQMKDNNIPFVGDCSEDDQNNLINTFDYLISNWDRNQSNVLYSQEDLQIWFIDHSRSFSVKTKRPTMLKKSKIKLTKSFNEALKKINYEKLQVLKPWLHTRQIRGIVKRKDKLIDGNF